MKRTIGAVLSLVLALWLAGCNPGMDGGQDWPLVFPWSAQLGPSGSPGDTIGMVIDSNYSPFDYQEHYVLHADNVTIEIESLVGTFSKIVPVRSVMELHASPNSYQAAINPGGWFSVAVFDLPAIDDIPGFPASPSYPVKVWLHIVIDGSRFTRSEFWITGANGTPNPIAHAGFGPLIEQMAPRRMVRLRPMRESQTQVGFPDTIGTIAGIEFDLVFESDCADSIHAFPASEAVRATAIAGPEESTGQPGLSRSRITLVDPHGFDLTFGTSSTHDTSVAGQGPIIEVVFDPIDEPPACDFQETGTTVEIENLVVAGLDGDTLLALLGDSTDYFRKYFVTPPSF